MKAKLESTPDPLQRFLDAQEFVIDEAMDELRAGDKQSHWMWFVFPQIAGLGQSEMAVRFAIRDREEAEAYVNHPVLGPRLVECCELLLQHKGKSATEILEFPDDMKLRSCVSLFAEVTDGDNVFWEVLVTFFGGEQDRATLELLD